MKLATVTIETPLGRYALVASEAGLVQAKPTGAAAPVSGAANSGAERMLARARVAFERYFAGAADAFASLPVDPQGSEFQRRVWRALREIPVGAIASYGEIARKVGSPAAARAVGDANRRNPIAIAIPCHRVIGGDGSLVGYAGGLERKRWLLDHESRCAAGQAASSNGPEAERFSVAQVRSRSSAAASI